MGNIDIAQATYKTIQKNLYDKEFFKVIASLFQIFESPPFHLELESMALRFFITNYKPKQILVRLMLLLLSIDYITGTPVSRVNGRLLKEYPSLKMENYRIPKEFNFKRKINIWFMLILGILLVCSHMFTIVPKEKIG